MFLSAIYDSAEVFCELPVHDGDHQATGIAHDENGDDLSFDLSWRKRA